MCWILNKNKDDRVIETAPEMRCLVTGSSGFIGRKLCRKLLDDGFEVKGVVRRETAFPEFEGLRFTTISAGEIGEKTDWGDALDGVDIVFHLAAEGGSRHDSEEERMRKLKSVNVSGTSCLAHAASAMGVRRFVYLSSIKANGESTPFDEPFTERTLPSPSTPYGVSKLETERTLWGVSEKTGLEAVVVRPPLVYGEEVKGNFLGLLKLASSGLPLPFSRVMNLRSLIYVENLLDILVLCAIHPGAAGQTFLVHDGEDISTGELIECLAEGMGARARLVYFPSRLIEAIGRLSGKAHLVDRLIGSLRVDSARIRNELGWSPPYSLRQGLANTASWYRLQGMGRIAA